MAGQNVGHSTVTKADIVEKVYEKIGFSKKTYQHQNAGFPSVRKSPGRCARAKARGQDFHLCGHGGVFSVSAVARNTAPAPRARQPRAQRPESAGYGRRS